MERGADRLADRQRHVGCGYVDGRERAGPGRERQILILVAEGHSNAQLARLLWVTEQTVKFHLSNIYRKLGVANRSEAARKATLAGLAEF